MKKRKNKLAKSLQSIKDPWSTIKHNNIDIIMSPKKSGEEGGTKHIPKNNYQNLPNFDETH